MPKSSVRQDLRSFGANVRRERSARGITQEKLAEMVDLNIRSLQRVESGDLNILVTTAFRIQRALECPWENLAPKE